MVTFHFAKFFLFSLRMGREGRMKKQPKNKEIVECFLIPLKYYLVI